MNYQLQHQPITGGDIFGTVYENELITEHKIMCPPNIYGNVVKVTAESLQVGDGGAKSTVRGHPSAFMCFV